MKGLIILVVMLSMVVCNPTEKKCTIEFERIVRIEGKCSKVFGGLNICKSAEYMTPVLGDECD